MSNISRHDQSYNRKPFLVFDTIALLSAKNDRFQVWRNNEQLGECYVPGATYAEITNLASDYRNRYQASAKEFLNFLKNGAGRGYKIQPVENNDNIPIDNKKDKQILACAHRLARENPNVVVVLVTYELALQALVQQSDKPNFCTLPADKLGAWFHQDYPKGRVPQEILDASQRMKHMKPMGENRNFPRSLKDGRGLPPGENRLIGNDEPGSSRRIVQEPESPVVLPTREPIPPSITGSDDYPPVRTNHQTGSSNISDILKNPIAFAVLLGILALGIFFFTKREPIQPNSPSSQVPGLTSPEPLPKTPPSLITEAETSVLQFQRTKDAATLKKYLNLLQELKNKQGSKLDNEGEQSLSRLKHKYAIEVLATSGQVAEAATLLKEIPQNYSEYNYVRDWLTKQRR